MKQTALQARKPLKRNTPLKARRKKKPKSKRQKAKERPRSTFWMKKADVVWSKFIRLAGQCAVCGLRRGELTARGTPARMEAHHIIGREFKRHRHAIINGICLCTRCHQFDPIRSAENNAPWFLAWLQEHYPEQWAWVDRHKHDEADPAVLDYEAAFYRLDELLKAAGAAQGE